MKDRLRWAPYFLLVLALTSASLLGGMSLGSKLWNERAQRQIHAEADAYDPSVGYEICHKELADSLAVADVDAGTLEQKLYGCVADQVKATAEQQRAKHNLQAQMDMALWARLLFWVTVIQIPLSIGGFALLIWTILQGREANRISRSNSEEQLRAWVSVTIDGSARLRLAGGTPHFSANIRAHNSGPTPARSVSIIMSMFFGEHIREDLDAAIAAYRSGEIDYHDTILFPNEEFGRRYSCEHAGERPDVVAVGVYVLAAYKTVFDDELRFTARVFQVIAAGRDDDLIDFSHPPFEDGVRLRPNDKFLGYAT